MYEDSKLSDAHGPNVAVGLMDGYGFKGKMVLDQTVGTK
jgi:hypothetical protein